MHSYSMKTVLLRKGYGLRVAGERATVVADIVSSYRTGDGAEKELERRDGVEIKLGGSVEPLSLLLDNALAAMKAGEVRRLFPIPREAVGPLASSLPPESVISYTVSLTSFQRAKPFWEMEAGELLGLARQHKEEGNRLFKSGQERAAAACYSEAFKLATAASSTSDPADAGELQLTLYLNLSACQLKLRLNRHAFKNCSRVLEVWPDCVKALYRRGVACLNMGDLPQAEEDLLRAREAEPGNTAVQGKLRELERLKRVQAAQLSSALRPMFAS